MVVQPLIAKAAAARLAIAKRRWNMMGRRTERMVA